jgi:hypothetical protein
MLALPEQVQAGTNQEVAMIRFLRPRTLVAVLLVLILSVAVYGFAAANVVPGSSAGDGSGAISGYTISNIHYALNAGNPANIQTVTFDILPATAGEVRITLDGATWSTCTNPGGPVSCTVAQPAATAMNLRVVAVE